MSKSIDAAAVASIIEGLCTAFKLPTVGAQLCQRMAEAGFEAALPVIKEVFESEADDRRARRVDRLRRASQLPPAKTFATFDEAKVPKAAFRKLKALAKGDFLDEAINVLAFGLPGRGKTHAACALGDALIALGRSVFFTPTFKLVQELLAAKRDLELPKALRKLDAFDLIILDDIGYVQQAPDEIEVLFTFLAERYERRSLCITSNLVFSEWSRIFKNPMTTAAAIDRLVHHSVILEFNGPTIRIPDRDKEV